jgi:hypothetical protein
MAALSITQTENMFFLISRDDLMAMAIDPQTKLI